VPTANAGDIFFDFEGDPLYEEGGLWNLDYLFGLVDAEDTFFGFWAHSIAEEKIALTKFMEYVATKRDAHPDMHIYHYAAYEKTHLLQLARRHGIFEEEVDDLVREHVLVDLYPILRRSIRVGAPSYSLKKIEKIYIEKGKATKENIKKVIFQYTYNPNAREMVKYLRERGYILSLVSGSVDLLVKKVANELKISYFFSNNAFVFDADNYLSAIKCFGDDIKTKTIQLKRLCDELKIDITETACIGDGDNDWEIFKVSQHGISFKGSKNKKYIWKEIGTLSDIKQIL